MLLPDKFQDKIKWIYHVPVFEYEKIFNDTGWPWSGHKYFGYDLIANLKPNSIVELGTHKGTSLLTFCQAIKDHFLDTRVFAIDTWRGDEQAGFYDESIFHNLINIIEDYYSGLSIGLIKKTFDEAVNDFEENSIDVLHIDGFHTYDVVKHDFENWLSKVKQDGIVILHDIEVADNSFGVYKLWEDLKAKYATAEFHHSYGLGILFLNEENGRELSKYQKEWQRHYSYVHETRKFEDILQKEQIIAVKEREIEAMKASKFWKLRDIFVQLRSSFYGKRRTR